MNKDKFGLDFWAYSVYNYIVRMNQEQRRSKSILDFGRFFYAINEFFVI